MESEHSVLLKPIAVKVIFVIMILWLIKGVELAFNLNLNTYGVEPGEMSGLLGLIFAPMIHGSFEHLLSNTLALFILTTALFYEYPRAAKATFLIIYFGSGLGVWLFARDAYHFGASGLTHGMMFFLFLIGVIRRDKPAMALAMIVFFLYGSMVWGVLPTKEEISFETHLFGALMGILCAIAFRNKDPKPPEKKYSWEMDDEQGNDNEESREDVHYLNDK